MENEKNFFLQRPEGVGISPTDILTTLELCEKEIHHLQGLMIAKDGKRILEVFYDTVVREIPKNGLSLAKSLTSLASGFCIDEGKLSFDTKVLPMFSDELPETFDHCLNYLTVRNLLTMTASSATFSTAFSDIAVCPASVQEEILIF